MIEANEADSNKRNLSQEFENAQKQVLKLPGIENYLESGDLDIGLELMTRDIIDQLEAEMSIKNSIQICGWSEDESSDIFEHPERKPFKSKLRLSNNFEDRTSQLVSIGNYLRLKYFLVKADLIEKQKDSGLSEKDVRQFKEVQGNLKKFWDYTSNGLMVQEAYVLEDFLNGIDPDDRKKGQIKLSDQWVQKIAGMVEEVVGVSNSEIAEVFDMVMQATEGGNLTLAYLYLISKKGDDRVRKVLEMICEEQTIDGEATIKKMQLLWKVTAFNMSMGMDLENVYELYDLPTGAQIEESLLVFMNKADLVRELIGHIRVISPELADLAVRGEEIDLWELYRSRSHVFQFDDEVVSIAQLIEKDRVVTGLLKPLIPVAFRHGARNLVDLAIRPGAMTRAYNFCYYNEKKELINISLINPRDIPVTFAKIKGHELMGHGLHNMVIDMARSAGELPENIDVGIVPEPIKEMIAILAENQIEKVVKKSEVKKRQVAEAERASDISDSEAGKKEWSDFFWANTYRRQVPLTLTQRAVATRLERMWQQGKRDDLTQNEAGEILSEVKPMTRRWYSEGLPMKVPIGTVLNNIRVWNQLDGVVYMLKYMPERTEKISAANEIIDENIGDSTDINQAFTERFGELWIENKQALIVFLGLMIETANPDRDNNLTGLYQFVKNADIGYEQARLLRIGITDKDL